MVDRLEKNERSWIATLVSILHPLQQLTDTTIQMNAD